MTRLLPADPAGIAHAAGLLRSGALVAFGTETVYGLGADATDGQAVARVFEAKGRPRFNPLICHFPDAAAAFAQVAPAGPARRLAEAFWPGPLTLVLPRRPDASASLLAGAGLDTLAVRVPAGPVVQALLRAVRRPVAAPSANRSGRISATSAADVLAELGGRITAVLDSGPAAVGLESTVLDLSGPAPVLLRPGALPVETIEALIGPVSRAGLELGVLRGPGLLASHYAPGLPVRLEARSVRPDEALLAFGPPLPGAAVTRQLSAAEDLAEAAANFFAALRALDVPGVAGIAAMPIPRHGLGLAINDRLARAAAPRHM